MAVLEILTFTVSEAFKKDDTLNNDLFEFIRTSKGLQHIYVAVGIEEPDTRWFILVWDSYEDHKALMDSKDYPGVIERLTPLLGGEPKMVHVAFSDNTRIAMTSPVTEIVTLELKDKQSSEKKEAFKGVMLDMIDHCHRAPRAKEHPPFAFGETREHPGSFYFLGGWTTVEHHTLCVDDPEGIKSHVEQIGQLATFKVNHAHAKEYGLRKD